MSLLVIAELACLRRSTLRAHCWMRRVLDLDPFAATSRVVEAIAPLGDDAFEPELASVLKHDIAVGAVEVFGQADFLMQIWVILGIADEAC